MSQIQQALQINAPELLTARERRRDTVFTAVMWGVYLYLWVPLVSLLAWLMGVEFAYDIMIRSGGMQELDKILIGYGAVVLVIFVVVAAWSLGNLLRYGGLRRRTPGKIVPMREMAEYFGVDETTVVRLRSMTSVSIEFDADGCPLLGRYDVFHSRASDAAKPAITASASQPW